MAKLNEYNDKIYTKCYVCGKEARFPVSSYRIPFDSWMWYCYYDEMNRAICGKCINEVAKFKKRAEEFCRNMSY